MKGTYVIIENGETVTYTDTMDLPNTFEKLISFKPDYPPSPHSEEDHKNIKSILPEFELALNKQRKRACKYGKCRCKSR